MLPELLKAEIRLRKYLHPRRKRLSTGTGGRGHRHLGGNRRRALAKAILRPIGSRHPNPKAAELELRLEEADLTVWELAHKG